MHEPQILFLDEPTAGVDVELRRDMWQTVRELQSQGVTIILTTHYIEEAEEMADRVGVINKGELILVEEKAELMRKLGKKQLTLHLSQPLAAIPGTLSAFNLALSEDGRDLMRLEVRKDNKAARTLYERHGYRRFGAKKHYYEDGHDAERYEKTLARRGAISSRTRR